MAEEQKNESDFEVREFIFNLAKMYEIPRVEGLANFLRENMREGVELSLFSNSFKQFRIVFKVRSKGVKNEK